MLLILNAHEKCQTFLMVRTLESQKASADQIWPAGQVLQITGLEEICQKDYGTFNFQRSSISKTAQQKFIDLSNHSEKHYMLICFNHQMRPRADTLVFIGQVSNNTVRLSYSSHMR